MVSWLNGVLEGLGEANKKLIAEVATYEVTDPTVDSQMLQLKRTEANVSTNITTPKFAAQAIKKAGEIGWKPAHYLVNIGASIGAVMKPAGVENSQGIITADPTEPRLANDPEYIQWRARFDKYLPSANPADAGNVTGWAEGHLVVAALRRCGDELTRENVMR